MGKCIIYCHYASVWIVCRWCGSVLCVHEFSVAHIPRISMRVILRQTQAFNIPLWCTQMGLSPWKIKWNQGGPGYWPPKCKNEIRGVQPHMLRKEKIMKIISHPTEGFAKIKSRGSRNKIKKGPSQHPKCSRNKTEGVQGQPMCLC